MMTEIEIERELHSCGLWFFVQFYNQLNDFTYGTTDEQESIRREIIAELKNHRRPDGYNYQNTGTDIRIGSAFVIFKKQGELMALQYITHSNRIDSETKNKAAQLLYQEKNKYEENLITNREIATALSDPPIDMGQIPIEIGKGNNAVVEKDNIANQPMTDVVKQNIDVLLKDHENAVVTEIDQPERFEHKGARVFSWRKVLVGALVTMLVGAIIFGIWVFLTK